MATTIRNILETGSTNADLIAALAGGERVPEGTWLVADRQTRGRGRQGRTWLDASGNFMGSTIVRLVPSDPPAQTLSFVAALALYETLVAGLPHPSRLRLKWPNDLQLDGEKFCGILLEREGDHAVIGIGVNLALAPQIEGRTADSLSRHGPAWDRDVFARSLAGQFAQELDRWRQFGCAPVLERWLSAAHPKGAPLNVHDSSGERVGGTFDGLEPDGALRLRLAGGAVRVIHAGDVEAGMT